MHITVEKIEESILRNFPYTSTMSGIRTHDSWILKVKETPKAISHVFLGHFSCSCIMLHEHQQNGTKDANTKFEVTFIGFAYHIL